MSSPSSMPDIFGYLSYPDWLSDVFDALQASDEGVTHREFSQRLGYKSSGAAALIMTGKRRLSEVAAKRIARALELSPAQRQHLVFMVRLEQAEDFDERARLVRRMAAARQFAESWSDTISVYAFYGAWYLPVVRELVSLPDFEEDPKWITSRLSEKLSPAEARKAIEKLLELGFLERGRDGRLVQHEPIVATPPEVRSDVLKQFQKHMMQLAAHALDDQPPDVRDMRVTTMAISHNQASRIKALLTQLQKEVLDIVQEDEPIEGVYQLNTQWFALTDPTEAEDE